MNGPLTIRGARLADLEVCAGQAREARVPSWNTESLRRCLADGAYCAVVAERSGTVVGFALGRAVADDAEILVLAVGREQRRTGVGRALFGALHGFAVRCGAVRLGLEVRASNHRAHAFYEHMGMRFSGRRPRYYADGEDARVMVLEPRVLSRPDLVILAGGRGRRLGGVVKARLLRDGRTLLERAVDALGSETGDIFVVAPSDIAEGLVPGAYRLVRDDGEGPARALAHAAGRARAPWMFVAAVDHVFWTGRLVVQLAADARDGVDAVLVREGGVLQPFGGIYRVTAVREALARGDDRSLAALRGKMVVREWAGEHLDEHLRRAFIDVDVPHDLRHLDERSPGC